MADPQTRLQIPPIVRDDTADETEFNYFALNAADRLKTVKEKIEEREKVYFELQMAQVSLQNNPESGEHTDRTTPDGTKIPCQCGVCELKRVNQMLRSNRFAIEQLRALYARLQ